MITVAASNTSATAIKNVQEYYGLTLQSTADLRTTACCLPASSLYNSEQLKRALSRVHPQVTDRFYGCGSPIPPALEGITVLDLGCGSGRDCYVLSQLVGPAGRVIGVDVTEEQLVVARGCADWHAREFGYANIEFKLGRMEELGSLGIRNGSIDLVVSNCVLNLSADKRAVMEEIFRVLKPGGELYFSDIFADRRLPAALVQDPVLHGECLAGAWYKNDFRRLLASLGCADARIESSRPIHITDPEIAEKIGSASFSSCTVRAFKLESLEDRCEDFGQVAIYRGTLPGYPQTFKLDEAHTFPRGEAVPVCGNTAEMLGATRYAPFFEIIGNKETHYGLFSSIGAGGESSTADCC